MTRFDRDRATRRRSIPTALHHCPAPLPCTRAEGRANVRGVAVESHLLIPDGSRLLHIGPPKTGTTSVQGALGQARDVMAGHGVVYPGREPHHSRAAHAVRGSRGPRTGPPVDPGCWHELVREVSAAGGRRVVVSSEVFASADDATVGTVVPALGGPRVRVVVTLRPLASIMPSAWQELVKQGLRAPYEAWLARVLRDGPQDGRTARFWRQHRHDVLVDRWASAVGAQNLTVVVVDGSDRTALLRVFEQMLGLPRGLLQPVPVANQSLSLEEAEIVRELNAEFRRRGWSGTRHRLLLRAGVVRPLLRAPQRTVAGQRVSTPPWAAERIAGISRAITEHIAASGVRVVGDLAALRPPAREPAGSAGSPAPGGVPADLVAHLVASTVAAAAPRAARERATRERATRERATRAQAGG